eukprot:TRINITY_DN19905_c0_g1_i1.p1 TRINITY_DN19905_c0_g1~~TRINITY_DN19905_c0_g1_i1.p1  ORF type:complete len:429 (-),score=81.80 TRINITY_DN19905_c0_g1_i1:12-1298(-)
MTVETEVAFATLSEKIGQLDRMMKHMQDVVDWRSQLLPEERMLLCRACASSVGSRLLSCSTISRYARGPHHKAAAARRYMTKIAEEGQNLCKSLLEALDTKLILAAECDETKAFYHIMRGEHYCYIAEFSSGITKQRAIEKARPAYEEASALCVQSSLDPSNSVVLSLALSRANFTRKLLNNSEEAYQIAQHALDAARASVASLDLASLCPETQHALHKIQETLDLWASPAVDETPTLQLGTEFDVPDTRANTVYHAQLAVEANRFEDALVYMEEVLHFGPNLSETERSLLCMICAELLRSRSGAWHLIAGELEDERENGNPENRIEFLETLRPEFMHLCSQIASLIDAHKLISSDSTEPDNDFQQIRTSCLRYIAECSCERVDATKAAERLAHSQQRAETMATTGVSRGGWQQHRKHFNALLRLVEQ